MAGYRHYEVLAHGLRPLPPTFRRFGSTQGRVQVDLPARTDCHVQHCTALIHWVRAPCPSTHPPHGTRLSGMQEFAHSRTAAPALGRLLRQRITEEFHESWGVFGACPSYASRMALSYLNHGNRTL